MWLVVAGCGSAPVALPEQTTAASPPARAPERLVDRTLNVGTGAEFVTRGTWALSIDGDRATLIRTQQEAEGALSLARADREAVWKTTDTGTEQGPVRRVGDHVALELASSTESLFMSCWTRSIVVASAGAQLVPRPGPGSSGSNCGDGRGMWNPPTTTRVEALICGQGDGLDDGQASGIDGQLGPLDETLFRFVAAPGVEFVQVSDGCFQSSGLRLARER